MQNATLSKFVIIVVAVVIIVVAVKHSTRHKFRSFTQWETHSAVYMSVSRG